MSLTLTIAPRLLPCRRKVEAQEIDPHDDFR
jgi:hypothetical protein